MDPQHQSENLYENDLAEFLKNFGQFWNRHGNTILIVLIVVVLAFAGYRFFHFRTTTQHETAWSDLAFETSPDGFRAVGQSHRNPVVQSLAYLRAGDLFLSQALSPDRPVVNDPDADAPPPTHDRETLLRQAGESYQQAARIAPQPIFRLNALMGLASVAESQRQWDDARQVYQQVIDSAGSFDAIAAQAQRRIALLPDLQSPVPFAPDPPRGTGMDDGGFGFEPPMMAPGLDITPGFPLELPPAAPGEGTPGEATPAPPVEPPADPAPAPVDGE
jgi:hypothetical protein